MVIAWATAVPSECDCVDSALSGIAQPQMGGGGVHSVVDGALSPSRVAHQKTKPCPQVNGAWEGDG